MRIGEMPDDDVRALYDAARQAGVTTFDHADIYGFHLADGAMHVCEERFGAALDLSPAEREEIVIQTKTGIIPTESRYDSSYDHIVSSAEGSLRALRTDYVDVLLVHRPDALGEPDEIARAADHLIGSGKVRALGVSNHTPAQIDLLAASLDHPIVVNQVQLSLGCAGLITQGMFANVAGAEQAIVRDGGGLLDHARLHGISIQAWSPLQAAGGGLVVDAERFPEMGGRLASLAERHGVTPTAIAIAWLTRHPAGIEPVVGTTSPSRLAEAAAGAGVGLSNPEWYDLLRAAGHDIP
jgi:predicted oxidoreductase